ncbi:NADH-quinone oxidoreductase subunit J [Deinococcus metalli]|uniref:NADH-quinone oxidoreductase subunit J n=1 Tax=Deinococcus metalli TaxID=1141878 RepID=A0A7W8KH59_9DEIO|nr:NADH-quinone oxidoreductase subunit J [Deinococcus metalli]MBB5376921.1 NADH-quinone oxidoreductase subunit J [Deinococcus metalli]GHF46326.1 NADH dehydrogenase subunit J [Deinococcus metalli]
MMIAFILLGALAIAGGVVAIAARNAVHAALGLVGTLLSVAGLFATMSASFLAATQVIVYAGAIMVLFLFVIMLLNANAPVSTADPIPYVRELAGIGGTVLAGAFVVLAYTFKDPQPLARGVAGVRDGTANVMGETLLTRFLLPFEAVSILLLVAIVGAVALVQRPAAQPDGVDDREEVLAPSAPASVSHLPEREVRA